MICIRPQIVIPGHRASDGAPDNIKYTIFDEVEHEKHQIWQEEDMESVFVETGTFFGHGVVSALAKGAREIHSIEINRGHFQAAKLKLIFLGATNPNIPVRTISKPDFFSIELNNYAKINLYLGDSAVVLPSVIGNITKKTTFWLDAHWGPDVGIDLGADPTPEQIFPVFKEIEAISEHGTSHHTIMIDDIHQFENVYAEGLPRLENKIRDINRDYKIEKRQKSIHDGGEILVARV